jgi:hypothetical protein
MRYDQYGEREVYSRPYDAYGDHFGLEIDSLEPDDCFEPDDFGLELRTAAELADSLAEPFDPTPEMILREQMRQARIAAGLEHACACCGCSESRACPGGCVWATDNLCSRCV